MEAVLQLPKCLSTSYVRNIGDYVPLGPQRPHSECLVFFSDYAKQRVAASNLPHSYLPRIGFAVAILELKHIVEYKYALLPGGEREALDMAFAGAGTSAAGLADAWVRALTLPSIPRRLLNPLAYFGLVAVRPLAVSGYGRLVARLIDSALSHGEARVDFRPLALATELYRGFYEELHALVGKHYAAVASMYERYAGELEPLYTLHDAATDAALMLYRLAYLRRSKELREAADKIVAKAVRLW